VILECLAHIAPLRGKARLAAFWVLLSIVAFAMSMTVWRASPDRACPLVTIDFGRNRYWLRLVRGRVRLESSPPWGTSPKALAANALVAALSNSDAFWMTPYSDSAGLMLRSPAADHRINVIGAFSAKASPLSSEFAFEDVERPLVDALDDPNRFVITVVTVGETAYFNGVRVRTAWSKHHSLSGDSLIDCWADPGQLPELGQSMRAVLYVPLVSIPLWVLPILSAAPVALGLSLGTWRRACSRRRRYLGLCPECGYDMRSGAGTCPECGKLNTEIENHKSRQVVARI
jgi:hypothetical protein